MKQVIKLHTMLNRIKLYEVEKFNETTTALVIQGKNSATNCTGKFVYPLVNIEHYNILNVDDNYNINLLK